MELGGFEIEIKWENMKNKFMVKKCVWEVNKNFKTIDSLSFLT